MVVPVVQLQFDLKPVTNREIPSVIEMENKRDTIRHLKISSVSIVPGII